jgi:subtilisin family serine protease
MRLLRRGLLPTLILAALVSVSSAVGADAPPAGDQGLIAEAESDGSVRVIVETDNLSEQEAVKDDLAGTDADVVRDYRLLPYLLVDAGPDAVEQLSDDDRVVTLQEDVPEAPSLNSSLPVINASDNDANPLNDTNSLGWDGTGRAVAILDTGIDEDHPFSDNRIVSEACYSTPANSDQHSLCPNGNTSQTGAGAANAETAQCLNGTTNLCAHGSHVAGIAAGDGTGDSGAPRRGVADDARIIAIQVFTRFDKDSECGPDPNDNPCVRTYPSDQIAGLQRVLAVDGTLSQDIVAANMSLGDTSNNTTACDTDARKTAIDNLITANIAPVISAGNEGHPAGVGTPGCISTAITVGATEDDDDIADFSNRGSLLDLFAPGVSIDSSVPDDAYANFDGTSMAAPHVTGAWAVLREAYPSRTVAQILADLRNTGQTITYPNPAGGNFTTPRIELLAALQAPNLAPSVSANSGLVTVNEGQTANNAGTYSDSDGDPVTLSASIGTVTDTGSGTWSWSFATNDGPDQNQTVTITATDNKGESSTTTFSLDVKNVAPSVTLSPSQITKIKEGEEIDVSATYSDPGTGDTHGAVIEWGTPGGDKDDPAALTAGTPGSGQVDGDFTYGDNGSYTIKVSVTDDDGDTGSSQFSLTVDNVNPTAAINLAGTVNIGGTQTFLAHAGVPVNFAGRSTDPGSDDLALSWDWGDGAPSPDVTTPYLVNGPGADPFPSPSVQPRDVTDNKSHAFGEACSYTITFSSRDDDAGSASSAAAVIITGNAGANQGSGYWYRQYKGGGEFSNSTLSCYLAIVRYMSAVWAEVRPLSTFAQAQDALKSVNNSGARQILDQQLIAVWLNFANGALDLDELVDTNGDRVADTRFEDVVRHAEAVRLDPASTTAQLNAQKNILERINLSG